MAVLILDDKSKVHIKLSGYEYLETLKVADRAYADNKNPKEVVVGRSVTTKTNDAKKRLKELSTKLNFEIRSEDRFLIESYFVIKRGIKIDNYKSVIEDVFNIVEQVTSEIRIANKSEEKKEEVESK